MIVTLKRRNDYVLKLEKDEYTPFETSVKGGLNGWYLGNVLFGGLIGIVIVDPLTGAMWTLQPDDVTVEMAAVGSGKNSIILKEAALLPPANVKAAENQRKGR